VAPVDLYYKQEHAKANTRIGDKNEMERKYLVEYRAESTKGKA